MSLAREDRRPGEQLRPSTTDCAPVKGPPGLPPPLPPPAQPAGTGRVLSLTGPPLRCGGLRYSSTRGEHLSIREVTMPGFAERMIGTLGRPVLDRTGLAGAFDVDLTYTSETQVVDVSNPDAPPLVTAMREQLGLRLEATRAPVEVLVIDSVELPTEN
jgi:uncharacterized protein (TIGR03435 family)